MSLVVQSAQQDSMNDTLVEIWSTGNS